MADASHTLSAPAKTRLFGASRLGLTRRQADILDHMLLGQSNREIAQRMHLAEGTIKNHVSTLLLMFGARSRTQLITRLRCPNCGCLPEALPEQDKARTRT